MAVVESVAETDSSGMTGALTCGPLLSAAGRRAGYRCSRYRGIPVHLLLGPVIGPSSAQGKNNDPSNGEDPHEEAPREENDDQNC
jgi:hypothetical protein